MKTSRWTRGLGAAGLALMMCGVAACVSDAEPSGGPSGSVEIDPAATVRVAWAGPPTNLDPHRQVSPADMPYSSLIYDRLTRMSPDGNKVLPMLAESWTFSPDGKRLELKLRTDVTFHDGTKFTSAVVKTNLERGKSVAGTTVAPDLASIASIDTPDDATVVLNLSSGGAALPVAFTTNVGEMVSPKALADGRDLKLAPGDAGSGAYKLADLRPNESATFERVDNYWDDSVQRAKTIAITVSTAASGINGLRAGQFDLVQVTIGPDTQPTLDGAKAGGYEVYVKDVRGSHTLMLNSAKPPLDNLKLRQAIQFAIDRDAIGNQLYQGQCAPSYQPFGSGNPAHNAEVDSGYAFNLDKAKQLLAESGLANPTFDIEFGPAHKVTAEAVQAQLTSAGINAQLKPVPQGEVSPRFNGGEAMATLTGIVPGADGSTYVSRYVLGGATISRGGDPAQVARVKTLAAEALDPTLSEADRGTKYQEIQGVVAAQAWSVQVCSARQLWAHNAKMVGVDDTMPGIWAALPEFDRLAKAR
ncbi:ABC transporter substrate-binding protein [Phytohabitans sp. ZYX-F-186]|uniref:ABC transporter substrate-binding protein n=1 Tax=Phytohabitans maris TaxID=3071409 RepID=A0ABU0ZW61_9ACTN|nr:ABC transporter substrate-binding protein [Phytohabitans sp. ZYX-F-186]MDQ7911279.1 ABC transporter substrate-binding protein [Phytohabitans sp. ZYX-F-186]